MALFDLRVPEEEDDDYLPLLKRPLLGAPHSSPCDSLADAFEVFIERRASTGHWVNRVFYPFGQVLSETGQVLSETDDQPPAVEDLNVPFGKYLENWLA